MATTYAGPTAEHRIDEDRRRAVRAVLQRPLPSDRVWGWVGPLLVTGLAAFLHFWRLSVPRAVVFDETYYAHDAWSLLHVGVEQNNPMTGPGFVVHPPLGKWMIALGEWLFAHGSTTVNGTVFPSDGHGHLAAFGYRFSAALFGTLAVLVLARTARRLFRSTLLGCVAGLLFSLDGLDFVQSRVSMLDGFLLFWVVVAFACLVVDRDDGQRRLAARLDRGGGLGPWLGVRPWRLAAGVCLGGAVATKWNGAFFIPAFVLLAWAWDAGARRAADVGRPRLAALALDGLPSLVPLVVVPVAVYVVSWTGWFLGDVHTAYDHDKYVVAGQSSVGHFFAVFHGWFAYQHEAWNFHTNLDAGHPYRSNPLGWLLLARPVAYYYTSPKAGELGCHVAQCSREVLAVGTPALWWASIGALLWLVWVWWSRRDWRAGAILLCFLAGYVPWFSQPDRTMFVFYLLPSLPFMVLAVTLVVGQVLGRAGASDLRRSVGATVAGAYLVLVTVNFAWLYPVLSAQVIPYSQWHDRMLFQRCGTTNTSHTHEVAPCWI